METEENIISNVCGFISTTQKIINKLTDFDKLENIWFRGESISQSNLTPLIPKSYRIYNDPINAAFISEKSLESSLKAEFERQAFTNILSKGIPITKWNLYFMMAHYGLRTRLLDWSQSALISLFFAIEDLNKDEDAKVWILNPHRLNKFSTSKLHKENAGFSAILIPKDAMKQSLFDDSNRIMTDELTRIYLEMDFENVIDNNSFYPLAIIPTFLDERMSMQQSCFTIFGDIVNGIFEIEETQREEFLGYVIINKQSKNNIKEELRWLGITQSSIYPDLEGISKSIEDKYSYDNILKRIK